MRELVVTFLVLRQEVCDASEQVSSCVASRDDDGPAVGDELIFRDTAFWRSQPSHQVNAIRLHVQAMKRFVSCHLHVIGAVLGKMARDKNFEQWSEQFRIVHRATEIGAKLDVIEHNADPLMVLGALEAVKGLAESKIANHVKGKKLCRQSKCRTIPMQKSNDKR